MDLVSYYPCLFQTEEDCKKFHSLKSPSLRGESKLQPQNTEQDSFAVFVYEPEEFTCKNFKRNDSVFGPEIREYGRRDLPR
jgi:hypothetical protein